MKNYHIKKYYIITIGCQMNKSDSERIASYLEKNGLKAVNDCARADLIVLTTCGVRESAENRIFGLIPQIKKENREAKIVLTGCLSERWDIKKRLRGKVDLWMSIGDFHILDNLIGSSTTSAYEENNYFSFVAKYSSKFSAFIPIGNGCDNYCTYCIVPYARGREVYRSAQEILDEARDLVKKGYKEINLIAQNVNSYLSKSVLINATKTSIDLNKLKQINFPVLLRFINNIPGKFWIRFATSHPKDMSDELINTVADCDKICEHIHLPVQAGDDSVLKNMNRGYTVGDYKKLIVKIRKAIPNVAISTDIIVGFPGETRTQSKNTVKLFKELKFDMAYIAQYSSRPGTAAAKLKDNVSKDEKKRRDMELTEILKKTAFLNNKEYLGKTVEILIDGKSRKGAWKGKTRTNKNVEIRTPAFAKAAEGKQGSGVRVQEGKFLNVKIEEVRDFGMKGEVVE